MQKTLNSFNSNNNNKKVYAFAFTARQRLFWEHVEQLLNSDSDPLFILP